MSIETRLIEAAKQELREAKVYAELEKLSGIKADSWRAVGSERQRATSEMLEWACQEWPQYAFWIATGVLPGNAKHTTPEAEKLIKALQLVNWEQVSSKEPINWTAPEAMVFEHWASNNIFPTNAEKAIIDELSYCRANSVLRKTARARLTESTQK